MEAFAYIHTPFTKAIKEELDNGVIGDILYMESTFMTSDYDVSNIRMRRETYGGALYDLGCYNTSQILWMLGEEPEKIQAFGDFSEYGVDMYTSALLKFKSGTRAALSCGMLLKTEADKRLDRFQIHGTEGYIKSEVRFNQSGELSYIIGKDGEEVVKTITVRDNYSLEVEQLGRCITDGETPHVSHEFTLKNARTIDRILESIGY